MANKKINQLVSKTAILSTDIFGIGDATTGQLFKKTIAELQAAIGGAVISVNGLVGTVVLDTDDIQELATPTNKYFTDARARGAISLTVTGNSGASTYSSGTGVLNVPTYTLAGLGGITAAFLSGTSGISYNSSTGVISYSGTVYTDASIRALLSGSTGITYNSSTGAISYSGTVYTDSSVRALISMTTTGTSGASTYNNTTGVINVPEYTLAGLGGITASFLSGGTGITYNSSTGSISYSGTVYTDASIRALISATGNISYNSTTGVISTSLTQYTDALARASISLTTTGTSGASTYNSTTGVLNIPQYAAALSGTTNYVAKFTSSTGIGNSNIQDNGSIITLGMSQITIGTSGSQFFIYPAFSANLNLLQNYNGSAYTTEEHRASDYNFKIGTTSALTITTTGKATFSADMLVTADITSNYGIAAAKNGSNTQGSGPYFLLSNAAYNQLWYQQLNASNYIDYWYNGSVKMTIATNGKVGIGFTGPNYSLSVSGSMCAGYVLIGDNTNSNNSTIEAINSPGGTVYGPLHIQFYSGSYLSVCNGGGNLLVGGTTNNGEKLYVMGSIRATGSITANSDISLKKNLLKIENALKKVEQINGYTYEFKEDDSKRHAGVIAQEIQTVLPEIVNKGNDGILGVEYGNISALLIEAIKEQQTQINELKALLNK
jgi:hypothetical protein